MSEYRKAIGKDKKVRYMYRPTKDVGLRAISREALPAHVQRALDELPKGGAYDDEAPEQKVVTRTGRECIFCGEPGTRTKFIHLQMVYLCDADYQNKTTGEVGGKVKEMLYVRSKEEGQEDAQKDV